MQIIHTDGNRFLEGRPSDWSPKWQRLGDCGTCLGAKWAERLRRSGRRPRGEGRGFVDSTLTLVWADDEFPGQNFLGFFPGGLIDGRFRTGRTT